MRIKLTTVEQVIKDNESNIKSMDDKTLPMVMAELQAKQAEYDEVADHRTITEIDEDTLWDVFPCWMADEGEHVIEQIIKKEAECTTV